MTLPSARKIQLYKGYSFDVFQVEEDEVEGYIRYDVKPLVRMMSLSDHDLREYEDFDIIAILFILYKIHLKGGGTKNLSMESMIEPTFEDWHAEIQVVR